MASQAQKHPVATNEHNGEDQNPGRDVDLANDETENVSPMMVGGPCGNISSASNIPFLSSKLGNITIMYALDTFSEDLMDANDSGWKNGQKLLELFKLPAGTVREGKTCRYEKRAPRMVPQCLLLDAKTVVDKMRVVNWWLSLEAKEMMATMQSLRQIYRAPTKSNDLFKPRQRHMPSHPQHPRPERMPSALTRITERFTDSMVHDTDGVSQGLATDVPTENASVSPGTETVFTALSSHVASVDPFAEDIFIEESVGPFIKEVSALYEGNSTQAEIEECKAFLAAQMEECKIFLAAQREERKTFLNSKIAKKKAELVQPNNAGRPKGKRASSSVSVASNKKRKKTRGYLK